MAAANPQSDRGQQRGDAAVQHGKTRDFTGKLDSFFIFVKTWIITTRIYISVSVSRFSLSFSPRGWDLSTLLCLTVPPYSALSELRILQTDFVRYGHKLYLLELSARSCHVTCIDSQPVPMLKSGDKDCVSQSGSGVGTLIAVM